MLAYRFRSILSLIIDLAMALIAFFLGMRIIFQLFQANPETPFVSWIYGVSSSLMYPFSGLFPNFPIPNFGTLDLVALITLLAYSILGYIILGIIRAITRSHEHLTTTRDHVV